MSSSFLLWCEGILCQLMKNNSISRCCLSHALSLVCCCSSVCKRSWVFSKPCCCNYIIKVILLQKANNTIEINQWFSMFNIYVETFFKLQCDYSLVVGLSSQFSSSQYVSHCPPDYVDSSWCHFFKPCPGILPHKSPQFEQSRRIIFYVPPYLGLLQTVTCFFQFKIKDCTGPTGTIPQPTKRLVYLACIIILNNIIFVLKKMFIMFDIMTVWRDEYHEDARGLSDSCMNNIDLRI